MSSRLLHPRSTSHSAASALNDASPETKFTRGGNGETIIVVEDDPLVRDVVVETVKILGYAVREAADGAGALRILRGSPEAVLLLIDVVLPGTMSGLDVARAARDLRPGIKIVFTAGFIPPAVQEACLRDRLVRMIQKPFRNAQLADMLAAALSGQV